MMLVVEKSQNKIAMGYALLLHGVLFVAMFISIHFSPAHPMPMTVVKKPAVDPSEQLVHAVTVSQVNVEKEIAKIKHQDTQKRLAEKNYIQKLQRQASATKRQRQQMQQQLNQLKAEKAKIAKQKLQDLNKAKQELAKLKQQQSAAEKKLHSIQQQALASQKQQLAAQKKADELKKQQLALIAKAEKEQKQLMLKKQREAHEKQLQSELQRYTALITDAIEQQWTLLPGAENQKLSTVMLIHLAPSGTVLSVKNVGTSGNTALDRLALSAVYKASPLPVPKDAEAFSYFRDLRVNFKDI